MDELQIPCADGAFTMRYPRGMSPADVDLVLPLVSGILAASGGHGRGRARRDYDYPTGPFPYGTHRSSS